MKKTVASIILILLCLTLPVSISSVFAQSLWSDSNSLYGDRKAREVGDIVTILISETSSASRVGSANNSKTSSTKMDAGVGIFSPITAASAGSSDSFKAAGTLTNNNNVTAKITAQVIEVKPNGNLVISGTQSIKQNNEEQKITVTGTVRTDDITPNNTVLSTYVANAEIRVDGKGPIAGKQRQGILTQLLNFLF